MKRLHTTHCTNSTFRMHFFFISFQGYIKYEAVVEVKPGDSLYSRLIENGIWPASPDPKQGFTLELLEDLRLASLVCGSAVADYSKKLKRASGFIKLSRDFYSNLRNTWLHVLFDFPTHTLSFITLFFC